MPATACVLDPATSFFAPGTSALIVGDNGSDRLPRPGAACFHTLMTGKIARLVFTGDRGGASSPLKQKHLCANCRNAYRVLLGSKIAQGLSGSITPERIIPCVCECLMCPKLFFWDVHEDAAHTRTLVSVPVHRWVACVFLCAGAGWPGNLEQGPSFGPWDYGRGCRCRDRGRPF